MGHRPVDTATAHALPIKKPNEIPVVDADMLTCNSMRWAGDHQLAAPHQSAGISNVPPTKRRRTEEVPGMPKKRGAEAAAQKRGFAAAAVKRVTNQYQDKLTAKVCCPCMELPRFPR